MSLYRKAKKVNAFVKRALRRLAKLTGSGGSGKKPTPGSGSSGGRKCTAKPNVVKSVRLCKFYAKRWKCRYPVRFRSGGKYQVMSKDTCATSCLCPWKKH